MGGAGGGCLSAHKLCTGLLSGAQVVCMVVWWCVKDVCRGMDVEVAQGYLVLLRQLVRAVWGMRLLAHKPAAHSS